MKRTTTTNLAVCDLKGGAVFEVTPQAVVRRPAERSICACTNHFCTGELRPAVQKDLYETVARYQIFLGFYLNHDMTLRSFLLTAFSVNKITKAIKKRIAE